MSGHNRKKSRGLDQDRDGPSLLGNRGNRSLSTVSDLSMSSSSAHKLSSSTRKTLLGMRNIKDPFSDETQMAIKGFHDYVLNASPDDINLEECSLLLSSTAKLFGMQIKTATKHMDELAAFVTNTAKTPVPENEEDDDTANNSKKRKRKEKVKKDSQDGELPTTSQEDQSSPQNSVTLEVGTTVENSSLLQIAETSEVVAAPSGSDITTDNTANVDEPLIVEQPAVSDGEKVDSEVNIIGDNAGDPSIIAQDGSISGMEISAGEPSVEELDSTAQMGDNIETADTSALAVPTCDINNPGFTTMGVDTDSIELTLNQTSPESHPSASDPLQAENSDPIPANSVPVSTTETTAIPDQPRPKRQTKEKQAGIPTKKRKLNIKLPPELTSIFDLDLLRESIDNLDYDENGSHCEPPLLYPEVDLWNGEFDLSADPDIPVIIIELENDESSAPLVGEIEPITVGPQEEQVSGQETICREAQSAEAEIYNINVQPSPAETLPTDTQTPLGVGVVDAADTLAAVVAADAVTVAAAVEEALIATVVSNDVIANSDTNPAVTSDAASASGDPIKVNNLPVLAAEDQLDIQNCINQLHYLPFTCELTKEELARTFHSTVGHLETIFKKNNMPFNRQLLKAASVVCANMVSSFSNSNGNGPSDDEHPPCEATFNSFREIFSQSSNGLHSDTIASLVNSEKTILERTREKSVAESRATIQKRLEEMQRMIVPKYIQWPLIAENTPEFYHRVKQFEQKMKKVLADEEKKESFDVSKYEIEVLAATAMESLEQEEDLMEMEESDDTNASSAMLPPVFSNGGIEEPLSPRLHHRVLSPISTSDSPSSSEGGRKWVPLSNVFNHMKKFDRNECARHFYAVLALLSSQNLDMNYDRHFSEESAAVVTQTLDHTQDSKYPRGLKIMTSRCPDADKEEIYVTALASKSCSESFRDLISHEMNLHSDLHQSPMHSPSRNNMKRGERFLSNGNLHSEPEQDEEFVSMNCSTSFAGNLFGGRNKKKN